MYPKFSENSAPSVHTTLLSQETPLTLCFEFGSTSSKANHYLAQLRFVVPTMCIYAARRIIIYCVIILSFDHYNKWFVYLAHNLRLNSVKSNRRKEAKKCSVVRFYLPKLLSSYLISGDRNQQQSAATLSSTRKVVILNINKKNFPVLVDPDVDQFMDKVRLLMGQLDQEATIMFSAKLEGGGYFNNSSEDIPSLKNLLENIEHLSVMSVSKGRKRSREARPEELFMKRTKAGVTGMLPPLVVEKQFKRSINAFESWRRGSSTAVTYIGIKCPFCIKSIYNTENGGANNFRKHLLTEHLRKSPEDDAQELLSLLKM